MESIEIVGSLVTRLPLFANGGSGFPGQAGNILHMGPVRRSTESITIPMKSRALSVPYLYVDFLAYYYYHLFIFI